MILDRPGSASENPVQRAPEYGSDLVVDLLQALGIEYAAFNPGASFRGLHDSLVNYGGDQSPRTVLCCHEEISVALAHGYAKATGRPMVAALHDVVGLQHACMAIFNAWCDRVPVLLLGGTGPMDSTRRRPWIEWIHSALVQGNHVRDFVKWDDQPANAAGVAESILRAYRLMTAEPTGPVYVCLDAALQEDPLPKGISMPADIERWVRQAPVNADPEGLRTGAEWLSQSRRPVILADTVGRSSAGTDALRQLAETLNAPVVDLGTRFNFPSEHRLEATERREDLLREADLILAVDVVDLWGSLQANAARHRPAGFAPSAEAKIISLTVSDLLVHSWTSDFQRMQPVDLRLVGESRLALPALLDGLGSDASASQERLSRAEKIAAAFALPAIRQFAHQVCATDQSDQLALGVHHRHTLQALRNENGPHTVNPSGVCYRYHVARHHLAHRRAGASDQVVLAHDADDAAVRIDHGRAADAVLGERLRRLVN